jgi:hypothetical protein
MGAKDFVRARFWTLLIWLVGAVGLYLRLSLRVELSGHMMWFPLLVTQSVTSAFAPWFSIFAVLGTVAAFYMKIALFRGPSGLPGAVVGLILAAALVLASRHERSEGIRRSTPKCNH